MDDRIIVGNDMNLLSVSQSFRCVAEQCNSYLNSYKTGITVLHVNIRSISCNFDSLTVLLKRINLQIDIIILSECWLSKSPTPPLLQGYIPYKSTFKNQNDGVVVYVKDGLDITVEEIPFNEANCLILKHQNKLAIIALYRSPSFRNITGFVSDLDNVLNTISRFSSIAIVGDININISSTNKDSNSDEYLNVTASHAMLPAHEFSNMQFKLPGSCYINISQGP